MSELKTNKISPVEANADLTLGDSGDTITIPAGVTITNNGTQNGFGSTNASDLTSGTLPDARFPATLPSISGANLTDIEAGGGLQSQQVFTASGTWTKPAGITKIKVYATGGGGSGSSVYYGGDHAGGGGGGGGTGITIVDVTNITSVTVTIGVGATVAGSAGSATSFGTHASGGGGSGAWNEDNNGSLSGGKGGTGGGDLGLRGNGGGTGQHNASIAGSQGGGSYWGGGGMTQTHYVGTLAGRYGGGGGGRNSVYAAQPGGHGAGGNGLVVVEEYK